MSVNIDAARHDQALFGIDHAPGVLSRQTRADGRDFAGFNPDIGLTSVGRGDHGAVGDEQVKSHEWSASASLLPFGKAAILCYAPQLVACRWEHRPSRPVNSA